MRSDFSRLLLNLRKEKNLSQKQVADDLEVSQALLSHYEKGAREPKLSFVVRAADYYNVSCDYILGRTLEKTGGALKAHQIEDTSLEKDNVVVGTMGAMLQKKVLINAISVILDIAGKSKNTDLVNAVSSYFYFPIYKTFRYLTNDEPETFNVANEYYDLLCDAEQKVREVKIKSIAKNDFKFCPQDKDINLENVTTAYIQEEFPKHAKSLFSVLQSVSDSIIVTTNPHTKTKPKKKTKKI